jgi:thiaminase/transcriptional activator TenA
MTAHSLIQNAGPLWDEATRTPFLEALAAGSLPVEAFHRWLAQDYLFAKDLMTFQAILLAKAPRDCHKALVGGLAALDKELDWFESRAGRLKVDIETPPHATCRKYTDFLLGCVYTEAYPVLIAMLFGVEASYLAAWSAFAPAGPYAEFFARWSSADFAGYVEALGGLVDRHPHEAAQQHFDEILVREREFWKMAWQG